MAEVIMKLHVLDLWTNMLWNVGNREDGWQVENVYSPKFYRL